MMTPRRLALVTGGSSGIGLAFAEALAADKYDLILVARDRNRLDTNAYQLRRMFGGNVVTIALDLSTARAAGELAKQVRKIGVEPTLLVNNAGLATSGRFKDADRAIITKMINIEVQSLTLLTHTFLPAMIEHGAGQIINVAALAAFEPMPAAAVFGAVKAYVLTFTEGLAEEVRGTGVQVTAVCPGPTDTPLLGDMHIEGIPREDLLSASEVAREALEAVRGGETVRVPGWENRLAVDWSQCLPRTLRRRFAALRNRFMMDY